MKEKWMWLNKLDIDCYKAGSTNQQTNQEEFT